MWSSCANTCACVCVASKKLVVHCLWKLCWHTRHARNEFDRVNVSPRELLLLVRETLSDLVTWAEETETTTQYFVVSCPRWRGGGQSAKAQFISRSQLTKSTYPPPWLLNGQARTSRRGRWRGEDQVEKNRRQAGQPTWGHSGRGAGSGLVDVVHLQLWVDNIVQWLKIMKVYSSNRGFELYKDIKVTTDADKIYDKMHHINMLMSLTYLLILVQNDRQESTKATLCTEHPVTRPSRTSPLRRSSVTLAAEIRTDFSTAKELSSSAMEATWR